MKQMTHILIGGLVAQLMVVASVHAEIGRLNPNPNPLQEELIETDSKSSRELAEDKKVSGIHRQKQSEFGEYWKELESFIQSQDWEAAAARYKEGNIQQSRQIEEIITYTSDRIRVWQGILGEYEDQLTQLSVNEPLDSEGDLDEGPEGTFADQSSELMQRIQTLRDRNQIRKEAVLKKLTQTLGPELSSAFLNDVPDADTYYDRISSVLAMIEALRFEKDVADIALKANELMGIRISQGSSGFDTLGSPEDMSDQTLVAWGFN